MLTVTQLANTYSISRNTNLYYERTGILLPSHRSENGYRWYGNQALKRLEAILAYRSFGVPIANIVALLDRKDEMAQSHILREQLNSLEQDMQIGTNIFLDSMEKAKCCQFCQRSTLGCQFRWRLQH